MHKRRWWAVATLTALISAVPLGVATAAPGNGKGPKNGGEDPPVVDPLPIGCSFDASPRPVSQSPDDPGDESGCSQSFTLASDRAVDLQATVEPGATGELTVSLNGAGESHTTTASYVGGELVSGTPRLSVALPAGTFYVTASVLTMNGTWVSREPINIDITPDECQGPIIMGFGCIPDRPVPPVTAGSYPTPTARGVFGAGVTPAA